MGHYIDIDGNYYEGDRLGVDVEVPQRPSHGHKLVGADWVLDLPKLRLEVWASIKVKRNQLRFDGGVKVGAHWFQSTAVATSEYNTLLLLSTGVPDTTVLRAGWRTMGGATVDMTPALVKQILSAGFAQVAAIDDAAQAHRDAMEAAADPAAYNYSTGWPVVFVPVV